MDVSCNQGYFTYYGRHEFLDVKNNKVDNPEEIKSNYTDAQYVSCNTLPGKCAGSNYENNKIPAKYKPSMIPRLKNHSKEIPTKELSKTRNNNISSIQRPILEQQNIQQVHHLNINHDFYPDIQSNPVSLEAARPIPTLGQIYRQTQMSNWFFESAHQHLEEISQLTSIPPNSNENVDENAAYDINIEEITGNDRVETSPTVKSFKSTDENLSDWLSSKLDRPTRDDSGAVNTPTSATDSLNPITDINSKAPMQSKHSSLKTDDENQIQHSSAWMISMSPKRKGNDVNSENTPINEAGNYITSTTGVNDNAPILIKRSSLKADDANLVQSSTKTITQAPELKGSSLLTGGQPVAVADNIVSDTNQQRLTYPIINADTTPYIWETACNFIPVKFPSAPNPRKSCKIENMNVPSYVEYPSEILQKTTNFEIEGLNRKISSVEPEFRDDLSSRGHIEEDSSSTGHDTDWPHFNSSQASMTGKSSKVSENDSWLSRTDKKKKICRHDYYYHYCWRKEVAKTTCDDRRLKDYSERCQTCQNLKRHLNATNKFYKPFQNFHKRISIGRICRYRLNHMWKKTTQRFVNWSNSPKCAKSQILDYLAGQSNITGNAIVQTALLGYTNAGTDALAKEQKSAEITATPEPLSLFAVCNKSDAGVTTSCTLYRSGMKHINIGPSLYHFTGISTSTARVEGIDQHNGVEHYLHQLVTANQETQENSSGLIGPRTCMEDKYTITDYPKSHKTTSTTISYKASTQSMQMFTQTVVTFFNSESSKSIRKASQRSIAAMTSKKYFTVNSHLFDKEIQVMPVGSIKKIAANSLALDPIFPHTKSNCITETISPCRKVDRNVFTHRGTMLSRTGTKLISVSSVYKLTGSGVPEYCKIDTVDSAVSTYDVDTVNVDVMTSISVSSSRLKDVSTVVDILPTKDEAAVQCEGAKTQTVSVAAMSFNNNKSFNGGSYEVNSSSAGTRSKHSSTSDSTGTSPNTSSRIAQKRKKSGSDRTSTGSSCSNKHTTGNCHSSNIGRSKLLAMRMLGGSLSEMATQVQPLTQSIETKTMSEEVMSNSMLTTKEVYWDKNCSGLLPIQTISYNDAATMCKSIAEYSKKPVQNRGVSSNEIIKYVDGTSSYKRTSDKMENMIGKNLRESIIHLDAEKETNSNLNTPSLQSPNMLISSNLNATKWINGNAKETALDFESIVNLSRLTVSESVEKASLVVKHLNTPPNEKMIPQIPTQSKKRSIHCVATASLQSSSKINYENDISKLNSQKEIVANVTQEMNQISNLTVNRIEDCETPIDTTINKKESFKKRQEICNAATNCKSAINSAQKSAAAITSRHFLPFTKDCCPGKNNCIFVYERPHCVIHNCLVDTGVQMPMSDLEHNSVKICTDNNDNKSIRSVGLATAPIENNNQNNSVPDLLPPRVYKALYDTTKSIIHSKSIRIINSKDSTVQTSKIDAQYTQDNNDWVKTKSVSNCSEGPVCPHCNNRLANESQVSNSGICGDKLEDLAASCGYYSNLLTKKLAWITKTFTTQSPPCEEESTPIDDYSKFFFEACTMKPSARQDVNCQTKSFIQKLSKSQVCTLYNAVSVTDVRHGKDQHDLKTVYYILTAIEGRVRRLRNNLQM